MKIVKFLMMATGIVGIVLTFVYGIFTIDSKFATIVAVAFGIPVLMGLLGTIVFKGIPRWASILSVLSFVIVAIKTREGSDEITNMMMVAALGAVLALVLAIVPDKPKA